MAELLEFPPPVTGERYDPADEAVYWRERWQSQRDDWRVEHRLRNKAERERDDALDSLDEYVEAIADGSLAGAIRYWFYGLWLAVGLFVGHLLTRAVG